MRKRFGTLIWVVFVSFILGLAGCGGGGGGGGDDSADTGDDTGGGEKARQTISRVALNPDDQEQLLSRVEFMTTGDDQVEAVEFYAPKETHGAIAKSALIYFTGMDGAAVMEFTSSGRPEEIYMPDGAQFHLEYPGAETVRVSYSWPNGDFGIAEVPLDTEMQGWLDYITVGGVSAAGLQSGRAGGVGTADVDLKHWPPMAHASASEDTKTQEVSEIVTVRIRTTDETGHNAGMVLRKPDIYCSGFDCKLISANYAPVNSIEDWVLILTIQLSEEVELSLADLYNPAVECEKIRKETNGNMAAAGLGLGVVGAVATYCTGILAPIPAAMVVGFSTLAGMGIDASEMVDKISCDEIVSRRAAIEKLKSKTTYIRIRLDSSMMELSPDTIRVSDFAPFSDQHFVTQTDFVVNGTRLTEQEIKDREECPTCPTQATQSLSAYAAADRYDLSATQTPQSVFAPAGYYTRCGQDSGDGGDGDDGDGNDGGADDADFVVWYTDNVRCWGAPWLYISSRDDFEETGYRCNYPGGGIDCTEELVKTEIRGGFATFEDASDWICPKIIGAHYSHWCGGPRAHWLVEGQELCFRLGNLGCGDLSHVPDVEIPDPHPGM